MHRLYAASGDFFFTQGLPLHFVFWRRLTRVLVAPAIFHALGISFGFVYMRDLFLVLGQNERVKRQNKKSTVRSFCWFGCCCCCCNFSSSRSYIYLHRHGDFFCSYQLKISVFRLLVALRRCELRMFSFVRVAPSLRFRFFAAWPSISIEYSYLLIAALLSSKTFLNVFYLVLESFLRRL